MGSEAAFLQDIAAGRLVAPDAPNTVDLAQALAHAGGVPDIALSDGARQVLAEIGPARRYVFLLLDGLGFDLMGEHRPDGFLARNGRLRLNAVCPSGTTAALTTLATGLWPGEHGLTSWWTHLPELEVTATVPLMVDRNTREDLNGSRAMSALLSAPLLAERFAIPARAYFPRPLASRPFARFLAGGRPARPYDSLSDVLAGLLSDHPETETSISYVYAPDIDKAAHRYGGRSCEVRALVETLDRMLEGLTRTLSPEVRLVVSADHGSVDVHETACDLVGAGDPLARLLQHPPSGERRFLAFHVLPGRRDDFGRLFSERFGESHHLLSIAAVRRLHLLGPRLLETTERRLGDFVAIPRGKRTLRFEGDSRQASSHGGLTPEEVVVPLVVV